VNTHLTNPIHPMHDQYTNNLGQSWVVRSVAVLLLAFISLTTEPLYAQITVSTNHRYLATKEGAPFFWLGDTDWEMTHRLTREDVAEFVSTRKQQGCRAGRI
jgi:hypothetical protein